MQVALPRHDAIVRQCVAAHGGHVFKTGGDAFCAAFQTALDAIAAALDAQRRLHVEHWPELATIRVRMAIHTGTAEIRDSDYFGTSLNRVARLLAAGHGGQTLLSGATHDLCRDHLPPPASAKRLGEHALRDLVRREDVFQLCHPDLPQSFPPLKTMLVSVDRETPSIAVLPFINLSPDEENDYFADGLSEELLNVLAKISGLRVASRTSAFFFKGVDIDIAAAAQKLNVATVLQGSVRKVDKRVRITAQLIQVATNSHLWSATYDRELDDIFAVQDDIAQSVVSELRIALLGGASDAAALAATKAEVQAASTGRADNPAAYRLYLQGRYFSDRMTAPDVARGVDYFRRALALDPEFPLAWVGLSQAYYMQAGYGWAQASEGYERARDAAKQALALAPDLAEGHVCLGNVLEAYDWNWKGADNEYQRALSLAPGNADVLRAVGGVTRILGNPEEAISLLRAAAALDPLSSAVQRVLGVRCFLMDRHEEAMDALDAALDLNPKSGLVHCYMCAARLAQGRPVEALELAQRESLPDFRLLAVALAEHTLGNKQASDAALQQLSENFSKEAAYQIAQACGWRGEIDRAFEWLERAYTQRDTGLAMTRNDPFFRPLHSDSRWLPFMRKMGFE